MKHLFIAASLVVFACSTEAKVSWTGLVIQKDGKKHLVKYDDICKGLFDESEALSDESIGLGDLIDGNNIPTDGEYAQLKNCLFSKPPTLNKGKLYIYDLGKDEKYLLANLLDKIKKRTKKGHIDFCRLVAKYVQNPSQEGIINVLKEYCSIYGIQVNQKDRASDILKKVSGIEDKQLLKKLNGILGKTKFMNNKNIHELRWMIVVFFMQYFNNSEFASLCGGTMYTGDDYEFIKDDKIQSNILATRNQKLPYVDAPIQVSKGSDCVETSVRHFMNFILHRSTNMYTMLTQECKSFFFDENNDVKYIENALCQEDATQWNQLFHNNETLNKYKRDDCSDLAAGWVCYLKSIRSLFVDDKITPGVDTNIEEIEKLLEDEACVEKSLNVNIREKICKTLEILSTTDNGLSFKFKWTKAVDVKEGIRKYDDKDGEQTKDFTGAIECIVYHKEEKLAVYRIDMYEPHGRVVKI